MARRVTLVCGPPCSGKTTWVQQHAQPGDIILDQDTIGPAAMRRGLTHVATMTTGTAWVIRCCPGPQRRAHLAQQLRATDTVLLNPGPAVLTARAKQRPNPGRTLAAIRQWWGTERADPPPAKPAPPKPRPTTTQQGLGWAHQKLRAKLLPRAYGTPCPRCGQPMLKGQALDLGHAWDRATYGAHNPGPRRIEHATCNRRAGQQLAQARRSVVKQAKPVRQPVSRRW